MTRCSSGRCRGLVEDAGTAVLLALENARLEAEVRSSERDLRASRARILAAGLKERRRLERDLHDTAQQRLIMLRLKLDLAEQRAGAEPARRLLRRLGDDVEATIGAHARDRARPVPAAARASGARRRPARGAADGGGRTDARRRGRRAQPHRDRGGGVRLLSRGPRRARRRSRACDGRDADPRVARHVVARPPRRGHPGPGRWSSRSASSGRCAIPSRRSADGWTRPPRAPAAGLSPPTCRGRRCADGAVGHGSRDGRASSGADEIRTRPPTASIRSRMLVRPAPLPTRSRSKPHPSSLTLKAMPPPAGSSEIVVRAPGPACLIAFCTASRQAKNTAAS